MSTCPFCEIVAGRQSAFLVRQWETWVAFFPLVQEVYGHTIIVPKQHIESIIDAPCGLGESLFRVCKELNEHYREALGASGFNLLNASGQDAQQSVAHLHFHFLPRFATDGVDAWPHLKPRTDDKAALLERLRLANR